MRTVGEIVEFLDRLPDEQLRFACLSVLSQIAARSRRLNQGYWTYEVISKWIGRKSEDPITLSCIQLLTSSERAKALDIHFLYFDPEDPDGLGVEIDDDEVRLAIETGSLIDPNSGAQIQGFSSNLKPYFVPSVELIVPQ